MPKKSTNELSMKIIYYKKKLKMTNKILAEKTGLPVGTISRIASGETKEPTLKTLRLIAKAFDCSIDDLQGVKRRSSNFLSCIKELIIELKKSETILLLEQYRTLKEIA